MRRHNVVNAAVAFRRPLWRGEHHLTRSRVDQCAAGRNGDWPWRRAVAGGHPLQPLPGEGLELRRAGLNPCGDSRACELVGLSRHAPHEAVRAFGEA